MPRDILADYVTVAERLEQFRSEHPDYGLYCDVLVDDGTRVLMRAVIEDPQGRVVSKGHAEEIRGQGPVNTTSAVENAETSAWGRALAAMGYGVRRGIASAEEMQKVGKPATEVQKKALLEAAKVQGVSDNQMKELKATFERPQFTEDVAEKWLAQYAERAKAKQPSLEPGRPIVDSPLPEPAPMRITEQQVEQMIRIAEQKKIDLGTWLQAHEISKIGEIAAQKAPELIELMKAEPDPEQEALPIDERGWVKEA